MTRTEKPRLRRDGSIDTAHYMSLARQRRSEQAHSLMSGLFGGKRRA
jgi:hypothetical protein